MRRGQGQLEGVLVDDDGEAETSIGAGGCAERGTETASYDPIGVLGAC